jgi:TonB family protein
MSLFFIMAAIAPAFASGQVCAERIDVPKYSPIAVAAQWTGVVDLTVAVGARGEVVSVEGSAKYPMLTEMAKENVKNWVFCAPAKGTSAHIRLRYDYRLEGAPVYPLPHATVVIDLGTGTIALTSPPMDPQP